MRARGWRQEGSVRFALAAPHSVEAAEVLSREGAAHFLAWERALARSAREGCWWL